MPVQQKISFVGLTEIGQRLPIVRPAAATPGHSGQKTPRQAAYQAIQNWPDFPAPYAHLICGPIFRERDVRSCVLARGHPWGGGDCTTEPAVVTVELVGIGEIASRIGGITTRQGANTLAARPGFPTPYTLLACGRLWDAADIARWAAENERTWGDPTS